MTIQIYMTILVLLFSTFNFTPENIQNNNTNINVVSEYTIIRDLLITNDENDIKEEYIPTITINKNEYIVGEYRYDITKKEFEEFVRVVEAEVTGENPFGVGYDEAFDSKLRVAQVILNRVESPYFPDTVHDVIFQKNAFTPLVDGRYWEVEISQVTIDACRTALLSSTKDKTNGCEFFSSGTKTCKYGSYIFTDSVGHSFFKSYRTQ